ncbi:hypothetical protein Syun_024114 [Stephania yunnanensis]|uniref:DNA (cytosine-5-)-methyltransferase n=1 Tax=Stephania yunnanensis TaxID=152371 RepID=A0AAP0I092_9MAGN
MENQTLGKESRKAPYQQLVKLGVDVIDERQFEGVRLRFRQFQPLSYETYDDSDESNVDLDWELHDDEDEAIGPSSTMSCTVEVKHQEKVDSLYAKDKTLKLLVSMGYPLDEAAIALDRCGPDASIMEVTDFISAAQMARSADALFDEDHELDQNKKRKHFEEDDRLKKKEKRFERMVIDEVDDRTHLPNPMVGFSLPSTRSVVIVEHFPRKPLDLLTSTFAEQLITSFGDFDLIIGGSPRNNLSGSNRYKRDGFKFVLHRRSLLLHLYGSVTADIALLAFQSHMQIESASCPRSPQANYDTDGSDDFDWDLEDVVATEPVATVSCNGEASSSAGPSNSNLVSHFVGMGFSRDAVAKAIEENGEGNSEAILESLLTQAALAESPDSPPECERAFSDLFSSESADDFNYELSDSDSDWASEEKVDNLSEKDRTLKLLETMGYPLDEAAIAMDRCGPNASIEEMTDYLCAAQMARSADAFFYDREEEQNKKRRLFEEENRWKRKKEKRFERIDECDDTTHLPNPMVGFGIPDTRLVVKRTLPEAAIGPPYFYYENVALAPRGVWNTIARFLYEIEPEFVDSKFFSAAARKRGYIHNLPLNNRFPLKPIPPQTIHEAFPSTKRWWPAWDRRTKLNCVQTATASAKLTERIRKALEGWEDSDPPLKVQHDIIHECKKWNLVWVGKNKAAPLEPDEIEMLLGFPKNHTRGGGISRTERYRALGNSFQVDTVAYHLSVLKDMFPNGISVLSLFSGIGGAEVALDRLGIPLKTVVAVEISEASRSIFRSWWEQSNQKGNLIDISDVQKLDADKLEQLISSLGGFDLVIGGSPCNNISGSNRVSRDGLEGKHSSLFYDYFRILNQVKAIMSKT